MLIQLSETCTTACKKKTLGALKGKTISFENSKVVKYLPSKAIEVWWMKDEKVKRKRK
jgi:hypothetical protein